MAFNNHDNTGYMKGALHVPKFTKNLVSIGQIVEQGIKVQFNKIASSRIRGNLSFMQEEKVACLFST